MFKRSLPLAVVIAAGFLTVVALLLELPVIYDLLLNWAAFLATVALLLGVLNLFAVHLARVFDAQAEHRFYSLVLLLSMLTVFGLALTDSLGMTQDGVGFVFNWIQSPLEAGLASLLPFILLFSGFQLLKRQRTVGSGLFLTTAVLILLYHLVQSGLFNQQMPSFLSRLMLQIGDWINNVVVTAGMRGLLIGIALGTITLSLRVLAGWERPYNS